MQISEARDKRAKYAVGRGKPDDQSQHTADTFRCCCFTRTRYLSIGQKVAKRNHIHFISSGIRIVIIIIMDVVRLA